MSKDRCEHCGTLLYPRSGYCAVCTPHTIPCRAHRAEAGEDCSSHIISCFLRRTTARYEWTKLTGSTR